MKTLNVLYQSNDYYAVVTGVSMTSLFENNKHIDEINVYILDDSIAEENKMKMAILCQLYGRKLTFVDTEKILKRLKDLRVAPYKNTYTTYFKLMALTDLDIPTDRIIQLDGDTVITGALDELINMDLTNYICAAAYDCAMNKYKTLIGIPETDKYYNCGVLLVNQTLWRSEHCEKQIIDHLSNVRNGYFTVDQDIINVLFRDKIKLLNLTYNFNSGFYIYGIKNSLRMYGLKEPYYFSEEQIAVAYEKPIIHHCMGAMTGRPWEKDSIHPQNEIFDYYLNMSPWKDYVKKPVNRSRIFKFQRTLYQILPRPLYMPLHTAALRKYLSKNNRAVQK